MQRGRGPEIDAVEQEEGARLETGLHVATGVSTSLRETDESLFVITLAVSAVSLVVAVVDSGVSCGAVGCRWLK